MTLVWDVSLIKSALEKGGFLVDMQPMWHLAWTVAAEASIVMKFRKYSIAPFRRATSDSFRTLR